MNKFLLILIVFFTSIDSYSQKENILKKNQKLIKALFKFDLIAEINDDYIQFQTKKVGLIINFGFGVAFKENGKVIYPAKKETTCYIRGYGKYIVLSQGVNLYKALDGMIDNEGKQVIDFKFDKIGDVFVPLPDSIITVQKNNKFGIFNLNTGTLSALKYDNSGNWLNDGYSYHEGGAYEANQAIYKQLGIENFKSKPVFSNRQTDKVRIKKEESEEWLVDSLGIKISKKYHYLSRLNALKRISFFIGTYKVTPHKYILIDDKGKEITNIYSSHPDYNDAYIKIDEQHYYFIATQKIIEIPEGYDVYVACYAKNGFLGFREYNTGKKMFADKYGNILTKKSFNRYKKL